ncbi:hypothetical protein PUMCH_003730 [Australozyma saopauloensis]|uniref:t-SNARE coiled-coil homology domain-containing protein n=1 Tax=Australozyma saopauloensis TaxID=291208 RepID=A0AAX4HDK7_9ASCO|nr:hypothetical protein PUMCH_003730 [[Candida] saopauloensis]
MSFNEPFKDDLEHDAGLQDQYSDFPNFEKLSRKIEASLSTVNGLLSSEIRPSLQKHEKLDKTTPTYSENAQKIADSLRGTVTKCVDTFKQINAATSDLNEYLRQCESEHADPDALAYLRQKESILISSTKNALHLFQRQQRKVVTLEKSLIAALAAAIDEGVAPLAHSQAQGQQQQPGDAQIQITYEPINAEELEQQLLLIQEREREIHRIAQDTQEINDIYLNLQDIVQEQQFQIDTIEDNILSYHGDVQGAAGELRRAERYQRRSGGRMLCCLFILLGVFGSVILVMVVF